MKFKNLKIGNQLVIGFGIIFLMIVIQAIVGIWQNNSLSNQTRSMYEHPLKVRKAVADLKSDILFIQRSMRDLILAENKEEATVAITSMDIHQASAFTHFDTIYSAFLGPKQDVDSAYTDFLKWNTARDESIRLYKNGEVESARSSVKEVGKEAIQVNELLNSIEVLELFAKNKADEYYHDTLAMNNTMNFQLTVIVLIILLLTFFVVFFLIRNIRDPLSELTGVTEQFMEGKKDARTSYKSGNEFGALADSFNKMAETIETELLLGEQMSQLSKNMLSENEAKEFFRTLLADLARFTNSQMATVYLLSDDNTNFEYFESVGTDEKAKISFSAAANEGEFGLALLTGNVQHLKDIPDNTHFNFNTVNGSFRPVEIITIPVIVRNNTIAVISLASLKKYNSRAIIFIEQILDTLNARIEGVLTYKQVKEFSKKLEFQNHELEAQKTELASQSSELMEQNTELEMQKNQLAEASKLKTNFLSNMSHELRTPLNSVIALSGVLGRRLVNKIPEEEISYLEIIQRNGKNLLVLINDILDISRIESGREEIEIAELNLNNLISELVKMINPQAKQKNVELLFTTNKDEILFSSDAGKCRHILQNIISNAVKFTEEGKVEISILRNKEEIEIKVVDTGIGIAEEHLPHIFDEFRQADSSTSRKYGGTGLGLAIAKKYANMLGGNIVVESLAGKGSVFTVSLPRVYDENKKIKTADSESTFKYALKTNEKPLSGLPLKTILLVEDSEAAIIQINHILEEQGYKIIVAHNGEEALEIIRNTIPDAMILDLMMPGVDGFSVLEKLRGERKTLHVPVLILTAKSITKEELSFLKSNNIHQLIQKGDVNRMELQNIIKSMLYIHSAEVFTTVRKPKTIAGKPRILIVEDNPDNMTSIRALLSEKYSVIEASNGKEGIEAARKNQPDLILMDIALPILDGIEAFKKIRKEIQLQHIPVIALTASAMIHDRETILAHGFDAYIAKPIEENIFFKTINDLLYE